MNGTNLFKIALRALANNKLRAFLTKLGIIIGVASVITMLAIGQGSKKSIQAQIAEMGSNMIMIHPGGDMRGGVRQDASSMQTLKLTDYEALRDETNFLAAVQRTAHRRKQQLSCLCKWCRYRISRNPPVKRREWRDVYRSGHSECRQSLHHR